MNKMKSEYEIMNKIKDMENQFRQLRQHGDYKRASNLNYIRHTLLWVLGNEE